MIFNYNRIIPINELEIKNLDDEDTSDDTEENVSDDVGEVEDTDDDNDYTEDMPEDNEASSDDSDEAASDDGDGATDYTEESPDDADGESSSGGDADAGGTDYTEESPDDVDGETEDDGGDESEDASEDDGSQDDEEDPEQSLSDMEKNLFSNLTAPQMAIKNTELLQNYINLNKTLEDIFININNIPRTYDNARVIEFIANRTAELRDMTSYIITDTYITRTYVENLVEYKKSLLILSQINAILKGLIKSSTSNKDS